MTSTLNSYERKAGIESDSVAIVGAETPISVAAAAATGIGLSDPKGVLVDTERVIDAAKLDAEAFMREFVEVHLHDPASEDEPQFAEVTVNGEYALCVRGETRKLRRAHLAVLAQAKGLRVQQKKVTQPDGSIGYQETAVLRLCYPFSVVHDANPKGAPWLRQLLGNPV